MHRYNLKVCENFFKSCRVFKKGGLAMNANVIATVFAILNILWVLPIGYFTVMDILRK